MSFDFTCARQAFVGPISQLEKSASTQIEQQFRKLAGNDLEKKQALDQSFKDVLLKLVMQKSIVGVLRQLVDLSIDAVKKDLCSSSMPFVLLSDIFDMVTLDKCEEVFSYVEEHVDLWKADIFYSSGKNYLLRMCNDLRNRLSKSQNTVFCGRIHIFLAQLFPASEKSGLNLMSQFNIENVTLFNTKAEDYEKNRKMSIDEKDNIGEFEEGETDDIQSSIPIDYNLYHKFWGLQDFFRKPTQCYESGPWQTFISFADDALRCFESFKLDDNKLSRKSESPVEDKVTQNKNYFAKYLTSEKLLDLQLSDSSFRRSVLVQLLILFQYLNANVKFKTANQTLTEEQSAWIKDTTERIMRVLRDTPPNGDKFAQSIQHILSREECWNVWKNDSCPNYMKEKEAEPEKFPWKRKRPFGEEVRLAGGKVTRMGHPELTKLWNLCPDNMEACRDERRNYLPSLETYFAEAVDQLDPAAGIEAEYKLVNSSSFVWKALRLLSRRSMIFFAQQPQSQQLRRVPEYLESLIERMAKEVPALHQALLLQQQNQQQVASEEASLKSEPDDADMQTQQNGDSEHPAASNGVHNVEAEPVAQVEVVTKNHVEAICGDISARWKSIAKNLHFPDDDIQYFESETTDVVAQARKMLTLWMENEGENATVEALSAVLAANGLADVVNKLRL